MRELQPLLKKTLAAYETIKDLSIDDLRHKTEEFRDKIRTATQKEEDQVAELRHYLEENYDIPVQEKEDKYKEIEKLEDKIYATTQDILNDILPEAFSVMKETARRFKENETITVTATQHDRDLAARRECITIEGDKAIYQNRWMAGGNMIQWDMCHYDVQLIGGMVLHQGKIAEMATGEGKTLVATLPVYPRGCRSRSRRPAASAIPPGPCCADGIRWGRRSW